MKADWHSNCPICKPGNAEVFLGKTDLEGGIPSARNGFTLLELLAVICLIVVIVAFTVPAISPMLKGSQLTQGSLMISEQLHMARQIALSKNRAVEVRFYQFGNAGSPGEQANSPATGHYRAIQLFEVQESGAFTAQGKAVRVPDSIIIDGGATLSSLIGGAGAESNPALTTGGGLNVPLPRVGTQYNCVSFRFLPGGTTDLPKTPGCAWFLTLHALNLGDNLAPAPPPNFFTIQIDPFNGHIKNFRP